MSRIDGFCAVILGIVLSASPNSAQGQGLQSPTSGSSLASLPATIGGDIGHVVTAPFRIRRTDGLKIIGLTAVTVGFVTALDRHIDDEFIDRDDFYLKPAVELAKVGDAYDRISSGGVLIGLSVPMLAGGLVLNDNKLLETTRLMVESFLISGAITIAAKGLFGRSRPFTGNGPTDFDPIQFPSRREIRSFPSGHTTSAFAMMTVIAKQYDRWWIEIPAYTVAASVGFQRIESRNHWGADVLVGGLIGYWVGGTLVKRHKSQSNRISVNPYIFGNRVGASLSF